MASTTCIPYFIQDILGEPVAREDLRGGFMTVCNNTALSILGVGEEADTIKYKAYQTSRAWGSQNVWLSEAEPTYTGRRYKENEKRRSFIS